MVGELRLVRVEPSAEGDGWMGKMNSAIFCGEEGLGSMSKRRTISYLVLIFRTVSQGRGGWSPIAGACTRC